MKRFFLSTLLAISAPAFALAPSSVNRDSLDNFRVSVDSNGRYIIDVGGSGKPITTSPATSVPGGRYVGGVTLSPGVRGVQLGSRVFLPIPNSRYGNVALNVASRISGASIVAAAGRCFGNPVCLAATTVGGAVIGEWLANSGYSVNQDGSLSALSDVVNDPQSPALLTGSLNNLFNCNNEGFSGSPQSVCSAIANQRGFRMRDVFLHPGPVLVCELGAGNRVYLNCTKSKPESVTIDSIAEQLAATNNLTNVLLELLNNGQSVDIEPLQITGPATVPGETTRETEQKPNPQTGRIDIIERVREIEHELEYDFNTITHKPIETIIEYINGVEVNRITRPFKPRKPPRDRDLDLPDLPDRGDDDDDPPRAQPKPPRTDIDIELVGCGLPNTPKCRIDEDGTPLPVENTHKQDIDRELKTIRDLADNPHDFWPKLPEIEWFFRLPTGCSALELPSFAPYISSLNVCKIQPIFHDLMSVVWIITGIFGSIGIFWRSVFAQSN